RAGHVPTGVHRAQPGATGTHAAHAVADVGHGDRAEPLGQIQGHGSLAFENLKADHAETPKCLRMFCAAPTPMPLMPPSVVPPTWGVNTEFGVESQAESRGRGSSTKQSRPRLSRP